MKRLNYALSYFAAFLLAIGSFNALNAQSTCPTAVALTLDMNCGGSPTGGGANSGDPTGNDDTDGNVCSTNYSNGDDYIYTYTASTDEALQLDLYGTNTWTGIMVTEGCPTTGTCFASSTSSSSDESLVTPPMTPGTTYYIHISTWPSPQSSGQFCLDASLVDLSVDVSCGTPANQTLCYGNNNSIAYVYESDNGSPLTLTFNAGGIESCCDDVLIYDGNSPAGTELFNGNNGGDMTGITVTASTGVLYITVDSDGSVSCESNSTCCMDPLDWTVTCDADGPTCDDGIQNGDEEGVDCGGSNCAPCDPVVTCNDGIQNGDEEGVDCGGSMCPPCEVEEECVEPTATATVVPYCGSGVYMIQVSLTDLGSASTVVISNNGGQPALQNVFFPRTYYVGPFSLGETVDITIADSEDAECATTIEGLTDACASLAAGAPESAGQTFGNISVFPNPTTGEVNVNLLSFMAENANIRILNAVGQMIEQRQIDEVQSASERFDLSDQQNGMYFIHIEVEGADSFVERVILGSARP